MPLSKKRPRYKIGAVFFFSLYSLFTCSLFYSTISYANLFTPKFIAALREIIQMSILWLFFLAIRSSTVKILSPEYSGNLTFAPKGRKLAAIIPSRTYVPLAVMKGDESVWSGVEE